MEHTLESLLAAGRNGEMTADDLWEAVMTVDRSAWTREDYAELTELFYSLGGKQGRKRTARRVGDRPVRSERTADATTGSDPNVASPVQPRRDRG